MERRVAELQKDRTRQTCTNVHPFGFTSYHPAGRVDVGRNQCLGTREGTLAMRVEKIHFTWSHQSVFWEGLESHVCHKMMVRL